MLDISEALPIFELLPVPTVVHLSRKSTSVMLLRYRQSFNALNLATAETFQVFGKFLKPLCFLQNLCLSICQSVLSLSHPIAMDYKTSFLKVNRILSTQTC